MKCPHCHIGTASRVMQTSNHGEVVVRRRRCLCCGQNFHTHEALHLTGQEGEVPPRRGRVDVELSGPAGSGVELAGVWK